MRIRTLVFSTACFGLSPLAASAQSAPPDFREEFLGQFGASAEKLVSLAEAMPAESMSWRPGDGVASVAEAYMHIARYNYFYPEVGLGVEAGLDYEQLQGVVTDKHEVVRILSESMQHVRQVAEKMTATDLGEQTHLYGRDVGQWAVLLQLVTHMNEHLGQSIAYARVKGIIRLT